MEVFLYNSTVCRLCGAENDSGTLLYSCEENNQNLCDLINTYLPIKVSDDGQLPRTICPGCTIQLEATVEFLNLIINGQKVIRELYKREKNYKKTVFNDDSDDITEKLVYEIDTSGIYQDEHPVALQMAGLEKPKRKRGRPPKKPKSPEEIEQEVIEKETEIEAKKQNNDWSVSGKRRRKTPTRFKEAVQGKELERIFKEEGVIDGEESEADVKLEVEGQAQPTSSKEPEVIGHMETSGELVVVIKGKGRGRPKGRMRPTREECLICGMKFSCVGRYMAHIAQHGPVRYRCAACPHEADTRLQHQQHQREEGHVGHTVITLAKQVTVKEENPSTPQETDPLGDIEVVDPGIGMAMASLPKLIPDDKEQENPDLITLVDLNKASSEVAEGSNNVEKPVEKAEETVETVGPKGKVRVKCNHCEKTFSSKQSKSLHIKAVHQGEKPYVCLECGCRFAYPRCLALHKIKHRRHRAQGAAAARRYACDLCGKVLNHPSSVVYHKEAEHAGQRYVCGKCGKHFKHKQLLLRHQLVHSQARPYSCKTCNASFKTKANLVNHQLLHSGVKKFSCSLCQHRFAHKTSLTLHMRWHTGSKPYSCDICGKSFSQKGNLSEHERIHTGEKPYQCAHCPRRFTTSSQARLHARKHQPDKPYPCSHCSKRFSTRAAWAAHQRRMLVGGAAGAGGGAAGAGGGAAGARTHWCGVCSRAFAERWALAKHMRRHTGERPHRCPHCPRAFADASNLNKHKKQVHKQISLLVNSENNQQAIEAPSISAVTLPPLQLEALQPLEPLQPLDGDVTARDQLEERVIYVAYDVDDSESGFQILDPEQAAEMEAAPLVLDAAALQHSVTDHMAVTDEQGNPLHFTMQDGTRLAITSVDGKSLQVITQDGQTIPVEINEYVEEEDTEDRPEAVIHHVGKEEGGASPVTHYFTIV